MKLIKKISLTLGVLMLAGCSGNKNSAVSDSDTVINEPEALIEPVPTAPVSYLTKDGIGLIKIDMSVNNVPDSVAGIYDNKLDGASEDAVTITFSDADGEKFIAYDFGEGKIDVINVIGRTVKIQAPRGEFGLGDKFAKVLELPGVDAEWSAYDGNGSWYWVWEGLWFAPSQETLNETLTRRLYNSASAPTVADFGEDVTVGFIGTGLPF